MTTKLERVIVTQVGTEWEVTISDETGNVVFIHNEDHRKRAFDYAARVAHLYQVPFNGK